MYAFGLFTLCALVGLIPLVGEIFQILYTCNIFGLIVFGLTAHTNVRWSRWFSVQLSFYFVVLKKMQHLGR